jgi:hypothetical protein
MGQPARLRKLAIDKIFAGQLKGRLHRNSMAGSNDNGAAAIL